MKLPRVTAKEVIKVLEKLGFVHHRGKGSHRVYLHLATKRRVVVSYKAKKIIPPGTLQNILRQAGLSREKFEELLKD